MRSTHIVSTSKLNAWIELAQEGGMMVLATMGYPTYVVHAERKSVVLHSRQLTKDLHEVVINNWYINTDNL
jgi:hypothetical protein